MPTESETRARIMLRPIASPMSLGFLALGGATLVLSGQQLGWFPVLETSSVAYCLMVFAFPLQFLASIFGFLSRDGVAATAMGVLATSWLVSGTILLVSPPGSTNAVLGLLLLFSGAALTIPAAAACMGKLVPALVLFVAAARFMLTGIYELTSQPSVQTAAGLVGLALLVLAWYAALALELEDLGRRTMLPVLRLGEGRAAVRGGESDQLAGIDHEAGVRQQL
ncbi:MAG: GPR1/FUN34/YaaH family transporter [Nocardioidaceae bacterium]